MVNDRPRTANGQHVSDTYYYRRDMLTMMWIEACE